MVSFCLIFVALIVPSIIIVASPVETYAQAGNQTSADAGNASQGSDGAIPPRDVIQPLRNETTAGFSNVTDVENVTMQDVPPVPDRLTTPEGMEKSQLGDVIPGEQGTQYEGEQSP